MSDATDYALARNKMVDGQIRPVRVSDPRIIEAMRTLPRELFVPPALRPVAYIDTPLDLGGGRAMLEPRVLARLIQLAEPRRGERALVIGAGTGYGATLLAMLGLAVTALEQDERLIEIAHAATRATHAAIDVRTGPLAAGLDGVAPFPVVLIEGGVELIPLPVDRLVATGHGRLVTVMIAEGTGQGVLAEHSGAVLRPRPHFDAAARVLPGFAKPEGFRF